VNFPISCTAAQAKFERAVALLHNFHYPETVKAFQAVLKDDPECAIAYWGLAMSAMPNPLVPPFSPAVIKTAQEAIQQGKSAKTQSPGHWWCEASHRWYRNAAWTAGSAGACSPYAPPPRPAATQGQDPYPGFSWCEATHQWYRDAVWMANCPVPPYPGHVKRP
jgi:hypothetical protein